MKSDDTGYSNFLLLMLIVLLISGLLATFTLIYDKKNKNLLDKVISLNKNKNFKV